METQSLITPEAIQFLNELHTRFETERQKCLGNRVAHLRDLFDTRREEPAADPHWRVQAPPAALEKRNVEITGPAEPKMMINALNSGADVFMADLEDALSPTWPNILAGHEALQGALRGELSHTAENGKTYRLAETRATLVVRPRGWHLPETRFIVDGQPMSASLFDFGLCLFHGGKVGVETGRGPFFYLPKLESAREAKLWADVFHFSELRLGLPAHSIRATVLIETLPGAMVMEDIVFALKDHLVGLNAGRWDYLFSIIKTFEQSRFTGPTFPDRQKLTMAVPFMRRYAERIVNVCHRRGAHAIGGMSAFIPSRKDEEANARAFQQVRTDKEREAGQGFDGTWVAHPDLVPIARACFEQKLNGRAHQKHIRAAEFPAFDRLSLLPTQNEEPFADTPTSQGIQINIDVSLRYLAHWLGGLGAVAIHGLMEDAATAEISRAQLWQWHRRGLLATGYLRHAIESAANELFESKSLSIAGDRLEAARDLLIELVFEETFVPFLTVPAMDRLKPQSTTREEDNGHHVHFITDKSI